MLFKNLATATVLAMGLATSMVSYAAPSDAGVQAAKPAKYLITSHVLDINAGFPAKNVKVDLLKLQADGSWKTLDSKLTNEKGRIVDFLPETGNDEGVYKLIFHTEAYYKERNVPTFYPYVEVNFKMQNGQHYHVPITLSPYGYSTYRGS